MNFHRENPALSDKRLRTYLIGLGHITPARDWQSELEEFEAEERSNVKRRFPRPAHLRLVNAGAERGR